MHKRLLLLAATQQNKCVKLEHIKRKYTAARASGVHSTWARLYCVVIGNAATVFLSVSLWCNCRYWIPYDDGRRSYLTRLAGAWVV